MPHIEPTPSNISSKERVESEGDRETPPSLWLIVLASRWTHDIYKKWNNHLRGSTSLAEEEKTPQSPTVWGRFAPPLCEKTNPTLRTSSPSSPASPPPRLRLSLPTLSLSLLLSCTLYATQRYSLSDARIFVYIYTTDVTHKRVTKDGAVFFTHTRTQARARRPTRTRANRDDAR